MTDLPAASRQINRHLIAAVSWQKLMKKLLINLFLFLGSVGWLVPASMAAIAFDSWVWKDVFPVIYGGDKETHSFPYYQTSEALVLLGFWWFAFVIVGWAAYFAFVKPFAKHRSGSAT